MSSTLEYIDRALETGERELACLRSGEVEEAERLAMDRGEMLKMAWDAPASDPMELLRDKLMRLKNLQGLLTSEARRLHADLKEDLKRARQENQRLSGYKATRQTAPGVSAFLDRVG